MDLKTKEKEQELVLITEYICFGCHCPIKDGSVFVGSYRVYPAEPSPIFCHAQSSSMFEFSITEQYSRDSCSYKLRSDLSIAADLEGQVIHFNDLERILSERENLQVNEPSLRCFSGSDDEGRSSAISKRTRRIAASLVNR